MRAASAPDAVPDPGRRPAPEPLGRHPLMAPCLSFVLGTWMGVRSLYGGSGPWAALAASAALWAVLRLASERRPALRIGSALALCAASGLCAFVAARAAARERMDSVETLRDVIESRAEAVLRGTVATEPSVTALPHGGARVRFDLRLAEIPFEYDSVPVSGTVRVDWYGPVAMAGPRPPFRIPQAGEGWQIGGRLREVPTSSAVPLVVLARRERDAVTRRVPERDDAPWSRALWDLRARAARALGRGVEDSPESVALVRAMTLGFRSDVPDSVSEAFKSSGTVHVFAISGLHAGIFALLVTFALSALCVPFRVRPLLLAPLLVLYVALTGARPSAVRACVMTLLLAGAPLAGRRADSATALCVAAAGILAWDPLQILDLGYHFSFVCTAGLLMFVPVLRDLWDGLRARFRRNREKADAPPLRQEPPAPPWSTARWSALPAPARWAAGPARLLLWWGPRRAVWWLRFRLRAHVGNGLAVSLAAWLVSAPLTAVCFGRVTPVSVLCNLAVIPLAAAVVTLAVVSLVFAPVCTEASVLCNRLAVWATDAMTASARVASDLPGAGWETEPWPLGAVAAWYVALLLFWLWRRARLAAGPARG